MRIAADRESREISLDGQGQFDFSRIQSLRILRFQEVLARLALRKKVDWAGVAADGGFYDQSHLNREFRAFAGVTPGMYHTRIPEPEPIADDRPSHVAVD